MKYIIYCLFCVLFFGCNYNDGYCREEKKVNMGVSLRSVDVVNETEITYSSTNMTITGLYNDSILYEESTASTFQLPLKKLEDRTAFILNDNGVRDTIILLHENKESFISFECGTFIYHTINEVLTTVNNIDSVVVANPNVFNIEETHLKVYYKRAN